MTRSTRCSTTTVPRPTRTASTGRRRVTSMHASAISVADADDERPVRAEAAVASEVQRDRRGTWRRDMPSSHSATNTSNPGSHRRRHRSATAVRTVSPHATPTTTPIDAPMRLSRNSPSSLTLTRNSVRVGERAARVAGLHPAPLHVVGALETEVGEHGRRDVGEVDEAVALRRGGTEETGREAGCADGRDVQGVAAARRVRPDTITMSERSTCSSSRPTMRSVASSAWARIRTACSSDAKRDARSARTRSEPSTNTTEPGVHASLNARTTRSGSSRTPNGAAASGCSSPGSTCPPRHLAVAGHQRRRPRRAARARNVSRACSGRVPSPLATTAAGDAGARQLVTEQADLGAVELAVVAVDGLGDRHVDQPVAGRDAGAGGEHVAGGVAPERLVDPEALAAGRAVRRRPRAGAQGDVAARERRRPVDAVGDHGTDGRLREQSIEVRRGGVVEVGPLGRGQRDDEHPAPRRRGRAGGRGADETDESDQSDHDGDQRGRADAPPPAWAHALTGSGSSLVFSP